MVLQSGALLCSAIAKGIGRGESQPEKRVYKNSRLGVPQSPLVYDAHDIVKVAVISP
jgi:hypothetical protein